MSGKSDEARRDMPRAASLESGSSEPWLIRQSNARRYFPGFRDWLCMLNTGPKLLVSETQKGEKNNGVAGQNRRFSPPDRKKPAVALVEARTPELNGNKIQLNLAQLSPENRVKRR